MDNKDENRDMNWYKIKCGHKYILYKSEWNGRTAYRIPVYRKNIDGEKEYTYKLIDLKIKDEYPVNGMIIRPLALYEDFFFRKDDTEHKNPIWKVVITDWEVVRNEKQEREKQQKDAINEYKNSIYYDEPPF